MIVSKLLDVRPNRISRAGLEPEREKELLTSFLLDLRGLTRISDFKLMGVNLWDHLVDEKSALYTEVFSVNRAEKELPAEMQDTFFHFMQRGLTNDVELPGFVRNPHVAHGQGAWIDEDAEKLGHLYLDLKGCGGSARELIDGSIIAGHGPIANIGLEKFLTDAWVGAEEGRLIQIRIPVEGVKDFRAMVSQATTTREEYIAHLVETDQAYDEAAAEKLLEGTEFSRHVFGYGLHVRYTLKLQGNSRGHKEALFLAGVLNNVLRRLTHTLLVTACLDVEFLPEASTDVELAHDHGSNVLFIEPTLGTGRKAIQYLDPLLFQLLSADEESQSDE